MSIQVKGGITEASVGELVRTINQQNHADQFENMVWVTQNNLRQSAYSFIEVETYHKLLKWVIAKSDQSSYIEAVPGAEKLFHHLFGYLPESQISGRSIRDINPANSKDIQLLEDYNRKRL